ncbi:Uncharacterised protein [Acinetobacter nosocomialis]|nr:Uncharacterised protein [Acinetobacter nosocomialis]SSP63118.1 Uncharacterised protein [Acinetobacter nosocomialis]SSQ33911.1 Uncharacterised protein [Acinetobacter baumannii]SSV62228.1 Uncharacterised protein [Acinetobacter nosocomialis]
MDTDMHNYPIAHISNVVCISYPHWEMHKWKEMF